MPEKEGEPIGASLVRLEESLMLYDSLEMLANSADEQIKYLKKVGIDFDNIDELVLEFDNDFLNSRMEFESGALSENQYDSLVTLDYYLNILSEDKKLWDLRSLKESVEWKIVRILAADCLKRLDCKIQV